MRLCKGRASWPLAGFLALSCFGLFAHAEPRLFPTDLPNREWVEFPAQGFSRPACGVIYRLNDQVTNGMPLGGIDVGCIDLETSGLLGYCTIFNSHVPRRGPLNLPFLGLSVGGQTWVLCDPSKTKLYESTGTGKPVTYPSPDGGTPKPEHVVGTWVMAPVEPYLMKLSLEKVRTAREIHYWGHYPVADLEI